MAIDVQRDYQRWIDFAETTNIVITHVIETHMHNDYLTGGYQLAKTIGATYIIPSNSGIEFEAKELKDNEVFKTGSIVVKGLHTPGHTEHHMSYLIEDGQTSSVFTGGSILYGTVGRTDLLGDNKTNLLTNAQYESAQHLGQMLNDSVAVYPTHGFGSFCSSTGGSGQNSSTIAVEKKINIAFTAKSKQEFVNQIIAGLGPYPAYYAHMGKMNQLGPIPVTQLHIHDYSIDEISKRLSQVNSWVVDIRERKLFAAHHPAGSVGFELGNVFATYAGWIIPWSDQILLAGGSEQDLLKAYIELSRIGLDKFVHGATSNQQLYFSAGPSASYQVADFNDLKQQIDKKPFVLDVRLESEWIDRHIPNSINIPLYQVLERLDEIPADKQIWVHCASGYRASIAASLLDKMNRKPILINSDFHQAVELDLC